MMRCTPRRLALLALALLALPGSGCAGAGGDETVSGRKVRVATTTNFITDTVRQVGGDRVEVTGLMGPGVDPHLYKASAKDVRTLRDADIIVYGGLFLEGKMQDVLDGLARSQTTVAVSRDMPRERLRPAAPNAPAEEEYDPHVWFDPDLWAFAVGTIADALAAKDPEHAAEYRRNAKRYTAELRRLRDSSREALAAIPERRRLLVTSHDAFGYFGRAFDVDVEAIQGISTATEATAADVKRVAGVIADREVPAVFVESSVPRQTIEAVIAAARARGQDVRIGDELFSDAAGDEGTSEGTYLGMVRANVDRIRRGLS